MITNAVVKIIYVDDFYLSNVIRYNCIFIVNFIPLQMMISMHMTLDTFLYVYVLIISVGLSMLEKISEMMMDHNRSLQDQKRHGTCSPLPLRCHLS